jgi:catechol 2,3-dioxygenase-like lactoylglutathione lyase family enzyme
MRQQLKLNITGLQHVGIPVTDLNASIPFYEGLGFANVMEAPFHFQGGKGTCVMMQYGNILIELYQLPSKELSSIKNRNDGRIDHIAFNVTDIDYTFDTLKRGGYAILEEAPSFLQFWKNGCRYFNIVGPDGERLEFNQVLD